VEVQVAGTGKGNEDCSELLWFGLGIKRNLVLTFMVWVGNKEKSSASRRDLIGKI
jgi:hypothetical protein